MRLIDADELLEHVWRDRLDSRELISEMIKSAPTIRAMTAYDICPYCKYRNRNCQFGTSECRFAEEDDDDKYAEQEPISVSVSEKEPDEISEEVTLRFFRNTLKVRWQDLVIYNVEWLKKNWQMEMDIVCGVKPCEDALSRQSVLDVVEREQFKGDAISEIEKLPSVRPQEQMGKWIKDECGNVICSECKRFRRDCRYGHTNYCNHCGCRMVEPQESE